MLLSFAFVIIIAVARSSSALQTEDLDSASSLDTSPNNESLSEGAESVTEQSGLWLGVFLCLCHAWLFSGIGVISRRLQSIHFTELMIHQAAQGTILITLLLAVYSMFSEASLLGELTGSQYGVLLGGCLCDSLAMISLCIAFQSESTSVVSMVGYLAIVYALITDIFVFGDTLSKIEIIGCASIVFITLAMGYLRSRGLVGYSD